MPAVVKDRLTILKNKARRGGWLKWIRSEADERALLNGCTFSTQRAEHVVTFFRRFCGTRKANGRASRSSSWIGSATT